MKLILKDCPEAVIELQHDSLQCTLRFAGTPKDRTAPENEVPASLQASIDACTTLKQLFRLLFTTEDVTPEVMNAFALRKLELEGVPVPLPPRRTSARRA